MPLYESRPGSHDEQPAARIAALTPRQQEIATLVAHGLTNSEIAQQLCLSSGTVANHLEAICKRLGISGRVNLAVWAVVNGLYELRCAAET
jgi:DNA-binding NarL/FixJ family response regulator